MPESDKSSILSFLTEEDNRRRQIESGIGVISHILAENAKRIIGTYEVEKQQLLPEAQERLVSVIKPWWQDFEESGIYQQVFEYLSQNEVLSGIDPVAALSEPIVFPWVRLSTVAQDFTSLARIIINQQQGDLDKAQEAASQAYEAHHIWRFLWTAHFYIAGEHQFRHDPGFGISQWPINGGGFAYAMGAKRNDINLYRTEADQLLTKVHPEVVIGFVEQIESGWVWQILQESLKPRQMTTISREDHARRQGELVRQYWERRQAR